MTQPSFITPLMLRQLELTSAGLLRGEDVAVATTAYGCWWLVGPRRVCTECGAYMNDEDVGARDGMNGCDDCLAYCDRCDAVSIIDETMLVSVSRWHDCERWCEICVNECAGTCYNCDEMFPSDQLERPHNDRFGPLMCRPCATEIREQQEAEEEEEERRGSGIIGEYHNRDRKSDTVPTHSVWSRANGFRLFGVELEVEAPDMRWGEVEAVASELLGCVNGVGYHGRLLWAERDGSLSNGFELITQPLGLDRQAELWGKVLGHSSVARLRSHNTTTCGLHVHVSRTGLSQYTIAKAVVFLNDRRNADLISAVARRYDSGYCKQKTMKLGRYTALDPDRYVMLNTMPSQTIEFRLFRGSTKLETVLGCVEFANAVLNFCRDTAPADLTVAPFVEWLHRPSSRLDSKNLRALIARRSPSLLGSHLPKANPRRDLATTTSEE